MEKARKHVFNGFKVDSTKVGGGLDGLDETSQVPTRVHLLTTLPLHGLILIHVLTSEFLF